jgi:hypothetical protein
MYKSGTAQVRNIGTRHRMAVPDVLRKIKYVAAAARTINAIANRPDGNTIK